MFKITTIHKKFVLIAAFTLSITISHGMITDMRELYNAKLGPPQEGQTLILMGDRHGAPNNASNIQNAVIAKTMTRLNGSLITEGPSDNSITSLSNLAQTATQRGLAVIVPDFRHAYSSMASRVMLNVIRHNKFDEITSALKEPQSALVVGKAFVESQEQNCTQFDILAHYAQGMRQLSEDRNVTHGFMEGFDTILMPAHDALNTISNTINAHTSYTSLSDGIMDALFVKSDDNTYCMNTRSIWHMTQTATNSLFDATLLKSIHEQRNKRVLFVHAGKEHTQRLATLLPKSGFKEETVASPQHEQKKYQDVSDIINDVRSLSAESARSAVDAEAFFAQCKTLPRE